MTKTRVRILRMDHVLSVDATGLLALESSARGTGEDAPTLGRNFEHS